MFEFPSLLWFLPLIGLPVLIHLINVLRHKRIKWAPMEFLLQSQKRNRTWVMLKQLLLLLMRMLAVAAIVLMLAQPRLQNALAGLLGGSKTHHIVLLDDSYSMSDKWADTDAFTQAKNVVARLGNQLSRQGGRQEFTLLLYSQASHRGSGMKAVLSREPVSPEFSTTLSGTLSNLHPSQLAVGPAEGLDAVEQMVRESDDSATVVYLVSDFRAKDWSTASDLRRNLMALTDELKAKLQLIDCVDAARPNLTISALKPEMGIRAAGVPLKIEVAVTNYGTQTARDVSIQLEEDGRARPAITIATIPAGQTASGDFEVRYSSAGQHTIAAKLPADAVEADNSRSTVIDFPENVPVLVIAGDAKAAAGKGDAYFLTLPFSSNNVAPTGIAPRIETVRFLRDKPLDEFHVIYLLDVDRLDQPEIDALEAYVKRGGGVAFFMGDRSRADFFNTRMYRDGKGLFPAPLEGPTELLIDRTETASDLTVEGSHPVFSLFSSQPSVDIDKVFVERYFAVKKGWMPAATSTARVVARLRNGAPLVVEQKFGDGRVMAFLTSAAPTWNNLARTPRYVGAILQMAAYLSAAKQTDPSREVGGPLEVEFDRTKYSADVTFITPLRGPTGTLPVQAAPAGQRLKAVLPGDAMQSGIYEVRFASPDKQRTDLRRFAYNVAPEEGDLKVLDGQQLESRLDGVKYRFHHAADTVFEDDELDRASVGRMILYGLIGLLFCEQLLAYSCSYHPTAKELAR